MATKIEWCDETWNPFVGCSRIAPECERCYAATFASRGLFPNHRAAAQDGEWTGKIARGSTAMRAFPKRLAPGSRVFTSSMTDFWHEKVPLAWLDEALSIIDETPQLTYQILTKRPGNVNRKLAALNRRLPDNAWIGATIGHPQSLPLLKPLRQIQASVHFISVEPLLAPMVPGLDLDGIDWVIGGGESGNNARRCEPEWMRALRDLCVSQNVAFFFKQWGKWTNNPVFPAAAKPDKETIARVRAMDLAPHAKGGATLDGRLWHQFPAEVQTIARPLAHDDGLVGFGREYA